MTLDPDTDPLDPRPTQAQRNRAQARTVVASWIDVELSAYADSKWLNKERDDAKLWSEGFGPGGFWRDFVDRYLHQAYILGLDTKGGQQALLKALVTLSEACVSLVLKLRDDGEQLPAPGWPSGKFG